MLKKTKKPPKLCLISSSGGHYEQLKMLAPLSKKYNIIWVTENTDYQTKANYFLKQTSPNKFTNFFIMNINLIISIKLWIKEKPDYIITTGTLTPLPTLLLAKIFRKKIIYIETIARVHGGTRAGRLMYKHADLFIIQWETLRKVYPKAVYGGSIY